MAGMGLDVNFVLQAVGFALVEKVLNTVLPGTFVAGVQAVAIVDPSLYVGALIIVGNPGAANQEVVTVTAITNANFTAAFANNHNAGETVRGSTFPSGQVNQSASPNIAPGATVAPLFTQAEILGYLRDVQNDMLERIRAVYAVAGQNILANVPVYPTPPDSIRVERVAISGSALWNVTQSEMDMSSQGTQQATQLPNMWYQDHLNTSKFAVAPKPPVNLNFDGTRIQTVGGTSTLKYQIDLGIGVGGTAYHASVFVKNQGPTDVIVNIDGGPSIAQVVHPGQTLQASVGNFEAGNNCGLGTPCHHPLQFITENVGDPMDIIASNPVYTANNGPNLLVGPNAIFAGAWAAFSGAVATLTQGQREPDGTSGAELWYSQKGITTPSFTDALIVPDILWYGLKYGILASAWGKDGETKDARRASLCAKRYQRACAFGKKFMRAIQVEIDFSKLARAGVA